MKQELSRKLLNDYNNFNQLMIWLTGYPAFYKKPLIEEDFIRVFEFEAQAAYCNDWPCNKYRRQAMHYLFDKEATVEGLYENIKDDLALYPKTLIAIDAEGLDVEDFYTIVEDEDRTDYTHPLDEDDYQPESDEDLPF